MAQTPHVGLDQHNPDWEQFPNLDGVIQDKDIEYKGKVPFVRWMIIQAYLAQHAPGWHFALRMTIDTETQAETPLYRSGDGTAYILGYFRAPKGSGFDDTPEVHYAVQDFRNNPIQYSKVSARDLTDADRRCRALAAALFFRLGWHLWTKDPFDDREDQEGTREKESNPTQVKRQAAPVKRSSAKTQSNQPTQANESDLTTRIKKELGPEFEKHKKGDKNPVLDEWRKLYKAQFKLTPDIDQISGSMIQTEEQFNWTKKFLEYNAVPQAK